MQSSTAAQQPPRRQGRGRGRGHWRGRGRARGHGQVGRGRAFKRDHGGGGNRYRGGGIPFTPVEKGYRYFKLSFVENPWLELEAAASASQDSPVEVNVELENTREVAEVTDTPRAHTADDRQVAAGPESGTRLSGAQQRPHKLEGGEMG